MSDIDLERYECWMCAKNRTVRVIHYAGEEGFYAMPAEVRSMGPWTGSICGRVIDLRPEYRLQLARDMCVVIQLDRKAPGRFHPEVGKG